METKFTKGEWEIKVGNYPNSYFLQVVVEPHEAEANAKLIAAAPEMLAVLYDAASVLDLAILQTPTGLARERFTELNIKVLTAIQKATP